MATSISNGIASQVPAGNPAIEGLTAGPIRPADRIVLVDVLRGFALLGIALPNWLNTSGGVRQWIRVFDEGAFFTAFSFLFGLGFALQIIRAETTGRPFVLRYLWRLAILCLIGIVHRIFIYGGDILIYLAVTGVPLLIVRRWRSDVILALAAICLVYSLTPQTPDGRIWIRNRPEPAPHAAVVSPPPAWCEAVPGLTDRYRLLVCQRAADVRDLFQDWLANAQGGRGRQFLVLCLFLLGLYAGRKRILHDVRGHTSLIIGVAIGMLFLGLTSRGLEFYRIALPEPFTGWRHRGLGNLGMCLFYLSAATLAFTYWNAARRVLNPLGAVGRMALTNYLAQSVIFAVILGQGLGLIGGYAPRTSPSIGQWPTLLLILSVFVLQIVFSNWWFTRYEIGPVEWAWRSLTWFRAQPFRKQQETRLAA